MIISRTPFRISFFGGGTDYPSWYREHGGSVLVTTVDKYCYLTCRYLPPFFEHRIRVVYSAIENCKSVNEIAHPAVRHVLEFLGISRGIEIHHDGDLPARSGMGSSSSFTVGLLHSLHALRGTMVSKQQLAAESIEIEQERLRENVGSQDQVSVAYGGFNHIRFQRNGTVDVRPVTVAASRLSDLNAHLMLFYTGIQRPSRSLGTGEVPVSNGDASGESPRTRQLHQMSALVDDALGILGGTRDLDDFGRLIHEAWQIKRGLHARVSNPEIEAIYEQALAAGALGGKLTGAGGGGFMLLFAPPERHAAVRSRLSRLLHVPFRFSWAGSEIIFYSPEQDYSAAEADRLLHPILPFHEPPAREE